MTKKKDTFSFIEQPRWHEGSIHNEFVPGKKADYAIQLIPTEALPEAREYFHTANTVAIIHMPPGVIGAAPFRALERAKIEETPNPIVGVQVWVAGNTMGHFVAMADGSRFTHVTRRRSAKLKVRVRKPLEREVAGYSAGLLARLESGNLELHPDPIEVPTRPGRMWMWSARWRELHAAPEWKVRPQSLSDDGATWFKYTTDVSFEGVRS
jgi:hypothetical protein